MTRQKLNKVLALALAVIMTVGLLPTQASAASIKFTDVTPELVYAEAYDAITKCADAGIVSGVGDNKFAPNNNVANPEMVKMIVNAYFLDEYNAYETQHKSEMLDYFGDNLYWFSGMSYFAKVTGLLNGVNVDIGTYNTYYQPMTRNDMARLLANAARIKGFTATDAQKAAAQNKILDYASIPAAYQDAAKTCYALGLLQGSNGYLNGSANMTRAEACIVLLRIEKLMQGTLKPIDPDVTPTPTPEPEPTPEPTPTPTPVTPSNNIKDIKGTQFETAIATLYAGGIITDADLTNGNFRPNDPLLVSEHALMHLRMFSNVPLVPENEWPSTIKYMGTEYVQMLKTPEGLASWSLSRYITGFSGGVDELDMENAVRDMHNLVKNMTYYTTNTAADSKWQPSYHGYGQATTTVYGECGAFDTNLDQTRMADQSWSTSVTRGEWAQIMYNLGVTRAGQLTAMPNHGGAHS